MFFGNDLYYPSFLQLSHCALTKAVVPYQRVTESDLIGKTYIIAGSYNQQLVGTENTELNFQCN
jgi:hypothetical protein